MTATIVNPTPTVIIHAPVEPPDGHERGHRTHQLTPRQMEALVYHELRHVGQEVDDTTGETTLVLAAHDFAGFLSELDLYGAWMDDMQRQFDEQHGVTR